MKLMKRTLSGILFFALLLSVCAVPALADKDAAVSDDVIYFEDGSYVVIELEEDGTSVSRATTSTKSGHKTGTYYNSSNELMFTFTVYGTFTYNGTTATATAASYDYTIEHSGWSFKSGTAYCSGNQAIAEATFVMALIITRDVILTLTCSPDGTLS